MNEYNEKQLAEDKGGIRPDSTQRSSHSTKGRKEGVKLSPGVKLALGICLTILFLWGYYSVACTVAFLRVGPMSKSGDGISSTSAIRNFMLDNPSVFFTGKADVAQACGLTPEMRRWNGWYHALRLLTFTFGKDDMEWNLYVFTEKLEDVENIKRNLASMISEADGKTVFLCVRKYHVWFYHSWPAPSPWDPEDFAKLPSYADYRLDLDDL